MAVGSIAAEHTQFAMFLSRAFAAKSLALLIQRIVAQSTEAGFCIGWNGNNERVGVGRVLGDLAIIAALALAVAAVHIL